MNQAIERRELVTLDGQGVLLRGTFHKPALERGHERSHWYCLSQFAFVTQCSNRRLCCLLGECIR